VRKPQNITRGPVYLFSLGLHQVVSAQNSEAQFAAPWHSSMPSRKFGILRFVLVLYNQKVHALIVSVTTVSQWMSYQLEPSGDKTLNDDNELQIVNI
jgi:hypothetical protein